MSFLSNDYHKHSPSTSLTSKSIGRESMVWADAVEINIQHTITDLTTPLKLRTYMYYC